MKRGRGGFTIVELLIVIVVIAILAAITIVAYNGIQERANNTKTQQALIAWVKALQLYKTDMSRWPAGSSCLGDGYLYGPNNSDTTGTAQCRESPSSPPVITNTAFINNMRPYIGNGNLPTPAFTTAKTSDTEWYRGLTYVFAGGASSNLVYIQAAFQGSGTCPTAAGYPVTSSSMQGSNRFCYYQIGLITDS